MVWWAMRWLTETKIYPFQFLQLPQRNILYLCTRGPAASFSAQQKCAAALSQCGAGLPSIQTYTAPLSAPFQSAEIEPFGLCVVCQFHSQDLGRTSCIKPL